MAHTLERLGPMFAQDHTVCVLARDHEQFYRPELSDKPSEHYYADNVAFASPVGSAFQLETGYPHSLILIGAEADSREIEYGWSEPDG